MPMKNPPHPGDFVRTEIIEAAGLTVTGGDGAERFSACTVESAQRQG
jgi:plasmid maintenance system antidote protein VapI